MTEELGLAAGSLRRPRERPLLPGNDTGLPHRPASPRRRSSPAGARRPLARPRAWAVRLARRGAPVTVPSTITIAPNITLYFQEVISDAIRVRQVEATDAAATYLVSLLCSFTHPDEEAGS